ncbi:lanthionine synthetase C family protein [Collimonas pratensis]|uniref:lanthionine synthetase C family protein n=1 Tax=Collimonas pratensis TaxID=279113 RepID=UPI003C70644B
MVQDPPIGNGYYKMATIIEISPNGKMPLLFDQTRHAPLAPIRWDERRARAMIRRIVQEPEAAFSASNYWPLHPLDAEDGETTPATPLYFGACGVIWALYHLKAAGAAALTRSYAPQVPVLLQLNRAWLAPENSVDFASYMMGDTGILLLDYWLDPREETAGQLENLIRLNLDNPSREMMWGAPGTMLAALFLHEKTGESRWAELFRASARKLWSQLLWSEKYLCSFWTQDMYGRRSSYLDGVHGFVATASPLIRGRALLTAREWYDWQLCISNTILRSAAREGQCVNWRNQLYLPEDKAKHMLLQFCHGAPGFIICLADLPDTKLDQLLLAGGEAIWAAGPLAKGSNLCHGTAGNGYAFLKLFQRTKDQVWLERARAFAMHAIAQTENDATLYGQMRYSLWTGDPGFAIYLWDCLQGSATFPSLDIFFSG